MVTVASATREQGGILRHPPGEEHRPLAPSETEGEGEVFQKA